MHNMYLSLLLLLCATAAHAGTGFIVAAPDRGFTGNEQVREAVQSLPQNHSAALVFVTDEGTLERLDRARAELLQSGADRVILMPFYLTGAHPDRALLMQWLKDSGATMGRPFGRSYPAVAALEVQLRQITNPASVHVVLLGHGAETEAQAQAMEAALNEMLKTAAAGLGLAQLKAVVWPDSGSMTQEDYERRLAALNQHQTVVLPFHLGPDLDAMMGFTPRVQSAAPQGLRVADGGVAQDAIARWLQREARRYAALAPQEVGVVVHAHGSDWHWNETMRRGSQPLEETYRVAYAFSMGDPVTLKDAVRELEQQGAQAAVIVRVFSMADSFRDGIVRFIGQAWESCEPLPGHHGHGMNMAPPPRLQTAIPVITVGGLEDHPLYAQALYRRALNLSEDPARETVILVAHGLGNEAGNRHWRAVLESIRDQMIAMGGGRFRAIKVALWSEDWPELRQSAVEHVRELVKLGNGDNGRVIIIPARTLGQGHADEYLEGLDYVLGEGFAPHPLFGQWLETQVQEGMDRLTYDRAEAWRCADP